MPHEQLALPYVLGVLSPVEHDALSRARLFDRSLEQTIAGFERQLAMHPPVGAGSFPPAELWRNIVSALAEERSALAGKHVEAFRDGRWQRAAPGIDAKQLGDEDVWLLRCDPGTIAVPVITDMYAHLLVIVAGDLCVASRRFSTGDYLCAPFNDPLTGLSTPDGCILLVLPAAMQKIGTPLHPPGNPDP